MLDELRNVSRPLALFLFLCGAGTALLLALVLDGGDGSADTVRIVRTSASGAPSARRGGSAPLVQEDESPPGKSVSAAGRVGQRLMVGLRGASPTDALRADARDGEIGGVVLFPEGAAESDVARAVGVLQAAARAGGNPPLLIATDQEGGEIKRFPAGPPYKLPSPLSSRRALAEGVDTGAYLRERKVNVDLAPVVDLKLPGSFMEGRAISSDPNEVTRVATAFSAGLARERVMSVMKHFPGLGLAGSTNTDNGAVTIEGDLAGSLRPFEDLVAAEAPAVMVSTAIYPALDADNGAAWSREIVGRLLRGRLGFDGLVFSDDLSSAGVEASLPVPEAVEQAAGAGVDLILIEPADFDAAHAALVRAAEDGRLSAANVNASYRRIVSAKEIYAR